MGKKNLISVMDMKDEWPALVDLAIKLKKERGNHGDPLKGKTLAMMFEKPSTRTRTSFDIAITELGGHALYLDVSKMQMGHGETVEDTARVADSNGSKIIASHEPEEACKDADVLYTDTWISMGDTTSEIEAIKLFQKYQINDDLLALAKPDCIVMHCLPAHRGQEITNSVIEGKHSVVFDQAENRLHAQKAVLYTLLKN